MTGGVVVLTWSRGWTMCGLVFGFRFRWFCFRLIL